VILVFLAFLKYPDAYSEIPSNVSNDEMVDIAQEINPADHIVETIEKFIL
jgi:hypothetical protein